MAPTPLQIKSKALGRLIKEESLYHDELTQQEKYVQKLKDANGDEYELKKQVEVLDETKRMIPALVKKIQEAKDRLETFLESYSGDEDISEAKENIEKATSLVK